MSTRQLTYNPIMKTPIGDGFEPDYPLHDQNRPITKNLKYEIKQ